MLSRGCCRGPAEIEEGLFHCDQQCAKLSVHDWLQDVPLPHNSRQDAYLEVRFKNSRKEYYLIPETHEYRAGDIVAVEASPGHDIGIVSLTGSLVLLQMKRKKIGPDSDAVKKVYRRARNTDIEKWNQALGREEYAKLRTRAIARELNLDMKINDVEFQGDNTKAIFYYTADERVDFRQLIKLLADEFRVRIEMRQIGVRQEASRLGGIGSCGRELCCSTWLSDFCTVTTHSARVQQLSPNPQKLAGQCGKLKCCLNYELDVYKDAYRRMPDNNIILHFKKGPARFQKADIFKQLMWYAYVDDESNLMALPVDKVKEVIEMNKQKKSPEKMEDYAFRQEKKSEINHILEEGDLTRFDD
jgi:cell fate regulator YaaT (PSP1 superfamily)